jgi:hypothetical protein
VRQRERQRCVGVRVDVFVGPGRIDRYPVTVVVRRMKKKKEKKM